ncbi:MAG: hypothetical protein FJ126_00935 [Deltaproteobacteria bacterium]|nr:hypothetical protein [Deltaproteobacteria bacterium]
MKFQSLIRPVRENCQIASAAQAGHYSLCGLVLRLRALYKWEHGLPPWREPDPGAVLAWVEGRERHWETLEGRPWQSLAWDGASFDPFQVAELNERLIPQGLAYGAGLARGLAPTFFLGELTQVRRDGDITILVLDLELARDLDGTPALCQGTLIYARKQALSFYLWDRFSDPTQQTNRFLKIALEAYSLPLGALLQNPDYYRAALDDILDAELEAVIHHEMGEALEPSLRTAFPFILEHFPQTRVEHWIRGLKDALAEVNEWGRLAYIIQARAWPSLAMMLALRPGLYSLLLPELEPAFWGLHATGHWEVLDEARQRTLVGLRQMADDLNLLLAAADIEPHGTLVEIERRFLAPLGL